MYPTYNYVGSSGSALFSPFHRRRRRPYTGTHDTTIIREHEYPKIFVQCGDTPGHDVFLEKGTLLFYQKVFS